MVWPVTAEVSRKKIGPFLAASMSMSWGLNEAGSVTCDGARVLEVGLWDGWWKSREWLGGCV